MTRSLIEDTAIALVAAGKGLLAMDESNSTCNKRFASVGIPQTEEARRTYRELLISTPALGDCISGAILYDETIRQRDRDGRLFTTRLIDAGIMPGIKVDIGTRPWALHPGETITDGLDGLRARLDDYARLGARFAKWRAVIRLGHDIPTPACIDANAQALARYAVLCQEAGLVPIVEPEILMTGSHKLRLCLEATQAMLHAVFDRLYTQQIMLGALILMPNMMLPALNCTEQASIEQVADATVNCLRYTVPAAVAGVAFLSGGQSGELASARLNAINIKARQADACAPWPLTFSFARAIQQPALQIWGGKDANVAAAQRALYHRTRCNHAAIRGEYAPSMDAEPLHSRAS